MQFTSTFLALAACLLSVNAAQHGHSHLAHRRHHAKPMEKRDLVQANSQIQTLPAATSSDVVEGNNPGMAFQNTLVNNYTQDAKIYFWKSENFAIPVTVYNPNPSVPELIVDLPAGATKVVSFDSAFSGAYTAVWEATGIQAGGGFQAAWVEFTGFGVPTVDVTMLPDMSSKWTSVVTDVCISDVTTCSFQCNDGSASCYTAAVAELINCQGAGREYSNGGGNGPWNGGCIATPQFTTYFSGP